MKCDGPLDLRLADAVAVLAERFEHAGGDVRAARIEHGVVVGEGDLGEDFAVDVAVERRPAAVAVLHAEQPAQAALARPGRACGVAGLAGLAPGAISTMAVSSVSG